MVATPGTFPSYPPYQPGDLTYTGSEIGLLVTSATATSAATFQDTLFNMANKPTLTGPQAVPMSGDLVAFFQVSSNLPMVSPIGNLGIAVGNLPVGGSTAQLLTKIDSSNFNATWVSISTLVSVGAGLATSGLTSIIISLTGPLATSNYTANALLYGNGTNLVGGVDATTAGYALVSNGSTSPPSYQVLPLQSTFVAGVLGVSNGGIGTASLPLDGVVLGNAGNALTVVTATTANYPLISNGSASAPAFQSLNLGSAGITGTLPAANMTNVNVASTGAGGITGVLPLSHGGLGTTSFSTGAVLLGNATNVFATVPATTAGLFLQSQGSASPPSYTTIAGAAAGFGLAGNSSALSISTTAPPSGLDAPINFGMAVSVASAALTINFFNAQNATPTATSPILIGFQSNNATGGTPSWASISSALSMTVTQSATLGQSNVSTAFRYWICLFYQNATQVLPALINCAGPSQIFPLMENQSATTVAIGSTAFSAGVFYSPNGTSIGNAPFRIAGYVEYGGGLLTPGYYSTAPTALKLYSVGMKRPGDTVQTIISQTQASVAIATTIFTTTGFSTSITPTSAANLVSVAANVNCANFAGTNVLAAILRAGATVSNGNVAIIGAVSGNVTFPVSAVDAPSTTAAVSYAFGMRAASAVFNATSSFGPPTSNMIVTEIMG